MYKKDALQSFASLKPGTFLDVHTDGQIKKATVLEVKNISGQIERFDYRRLYLRLFQTDNLYTSAGRASKTIQGGKSSFYRRSIKSPQMWICCIKSIPDWSFKKIYLSTL